MILQALTRYYEALVRLGKLDRPGWNKVKVSFALELDENGSLVRIHSLREERELGKKKVLMPIEMTAPTPVMRTGQSIRPNFLRDNASYLLGIDKPEYEQRAYQRFDASKGLHLSLLQSVNTPCATGIKRFFESWDPKKANDRLKDNQYYKDIVDGANLVFLVDSVFGQTDPMIMETWQAEYDSRGEDPKAERERCLVTGALVVPQLTHPQIAGISSGAAPLVSFDKNAFQSYNKESSLNAPVGKYAAFAYATALQYLVNDDKHKKRFGDTNNGDTTTVVYWAEDGAEIYQDVLLEIMNASDRLNDDDLDAIIQKLSRGISVMIDDVMVNPSNRFYILGLSPNKGRLAVRFFYESEFGQVIQHLKQHEKRMELIPNVRTPNNRIPLWKMIAATEIMKSEKSSLNNHLLGDILRAALSNSRYPETLFYQTEMRIKAENYRSSAVSEKERYVLNERLWIQLSIVKAYLLQNGRNQQIKEGLTVQLNDQTTYQPYLLGRLFAVLETIQEKAQGNLNTTIKDKYFTSACATPSVVFPILLNLKDKHLKKLDGGMRVYYDRQVSELMGKLTEDYPAHLSLQDQGVFQIGYYHQKQKRFEKKNQEEA